MPLGANDFAAFFRELYGYPPFPWQARLATQVAETGAWPETLDLPTGAGKTAAIDIAIFHLAIEADRPERRAPVRIAFIVDRRLVVDDAFERAKQLAQALREPRTPVLSAMSERLRLLSGTSDALIVRRLRGGIPREDDWARTPSQPTVLCSTVDQVGSRLLFRGYGITDRMKPIHAGLLGADCLILLDEAHLCEPFRQTLRSVAVYHGDRWRDSERGHRTAWATASLTATPGNNAASPFTLRHDDRAHSVLSRRLAAPKLARLVEAGRRRSDSDQQELEPSQASERELVAAMVAEVGSAMAVLAGRGIAAPAVGVVANRVRRARAVFAALREAFPAAADRMVLMIGPSRAIERETLVATALAPIRTGVERVLEAPLVVVATQCIEAGVDIDLDALITEAAPLDALRQRFGRLNRAGREIVPYAAIVAEKAELSTRHDDPVYGAAIRPTWEYLAANTRAEGKVPVVDFGVEALERMMAASAPPPESRVRLSDAPVLMPVHVDLLSRTSPVPACDPHVAFYLHGFERDGDSVSVVWRADVDPAWQSDDQVRRLLLLVPPLAGEAIQLPVWTVRRWLARSRGDAIDVADVPASGPDDDVPRQGRRAFRWRGDDEQSEWIDPRDIRPGDSIVVPASYGGVDEFGWNPESPSSEADVATTLDVAQRAAEPFAGRRFAVRVAPGLCGDVHDDDLAAAVAAAASGDWRMRRAALEALPLPEGLREALARLDAGRGGRVVVYDDVYGEDIDSRPRGVVFVAPRGLEQNAVPTDSAMASSEDDVSGAMPGFACSLKQHCADVERVAAMYARLAGLPEPRVRDLQLAARYHDVGKADRRWQAWIHGGDPLGPDPDDSTQVLAKSSRPIPAHSWKASGLPDRWRHEALSVRVLSAADSLLEDADDPELVLWLVGTHHGYGRPFFPHADPVDAVARTLAAFEGLPGELPAGDGPQSLAFNWRGMDWAGMGERLQARYGAWGLAHMEAILRLADHRASEDESAAHDREGDGR